MMMGFLLSTKPHTLAADAVALLLFSIIPIVSGATLIVSHFRNKKREEGEQQKLRLAAREKEVLLLARRLDGRLTMAQIVTETSMDAAGAEETMNELVVKGMASLRTNEEGQMFYEFFDMVSREEEQTLRPSHPDVLRES